MRISDWSSDVCSSDLHPFASREEEEVSNGPLRLERTVRRAVAAEEGRDRAGGRWPRPDQDLVAPLHHSPAVRRADVQRLQWPEIRSRLGERGHGRHEAGRVRSDPLLPGPRVRQRSEEHKSELPSLLRIYYADFCWNKKHN